MRAVGAQAGLDARGGLAVAVGDEVVGIAARDRVVRLEVAVADHVVVVALEQRHLRREEGGQPITLPALPCAPPGTSPRTLPVPQSSLHALAALRQSQRWQAARLRHPDERRLDAQGGA